MTDQEFDIELLRKLTPAAKLTAMHGLIRQAYELKVAGLLALRPGLSEAEAWAQAREYISGDRP